jgi:subtilase family serine protease
MTGLILGALVSLGLPPGPAAGLAGPDRFGSLLSIVNLGCGSVAGPGQVACLGKAVGRYNSPLITSNPRGYQPADIRAAYNLATADSKATVAIVDAMDDPMAESDVAVYRARFSLAPCTTSNGCFKKVNQAGKAGPLPAGDYGWAQEISLDLDAVSATCPSCHILLVEANTPTTQDLMTAVDTAARTPGVLAISNSYGGPEDATIKAGDHHLFHPGIAITAGAGDAGYGLSWPASSPLVTAVGGTTLTRSSTPRGWSEMVWSGTGSGCSASEAKPGWQRDKGCKNRTVADVAADADPRTGLAVYDTYNSCGRSSLCDLLLSLGLAQGSDGYIQVGGTSLGTPVIASVFAMAGHHGYPWLPYGHSKLLNDVKSGSNGNCGGSYLCKAGVGYDGPTGLGTPNTTAAF